VGAQIVFRFRRASEINNFLGLTLPQNPRWQYVQIAATDLSGARVPLSQIRRVAMHELGHALGIGGHSPNLQDLMGNFSKSIAPSQADVNTLLICYGGSFPQCK
jgi:predicted Zn-dependent protease